LNNEVDELKETNIIQKKIISTKDDTTSRLRGLLHEIMLKDNKDVDYISDLFDKDLDDYEDEIIAAYGINEDE
jgi:hypothetical protein